MYSEDNESDNCTTTDLQESVPCKGLSLKQVFYLLSEEGVIEVNGTEFGRIFSDGSEVTVRMNECTGKNMNRNGTCESCYKIYRCKLKKANYQKKNILMYQSSVFKKLESLNKVII